MARLWYPKCFSQQEVRRRVLSLDKWIENISDEIEVISHTEGNCFNIMRLPGNGPLTATAMVAAIGKGGAFDQGREFAAKYQERLHRSSIFS